MGSVLVQKNAGSVDNEIIQGEKARFFLGEVRETRTNYKLVHWWLSLCIPIDLNIFVRDGIASLW